MKTIVGKVIVCAVVCIILGIFVSPVLALEVVKPLTLEVKPSSITYDKPSSQPIAEIVTSTPALTVKPVTQPLQVITPIKPSQVLADPVISTYSLQPTINSRTPDALIANLDLKDDSLLDANPANPLEPGPDQEFEPDPFNPDPNDAIISATPSDVFTEPGKIKLDYADTGLPINPGTTTFNGKEFSTQDDSFSGYKSPLEEEYGKPGLDTNDLLKKVDTPPGSMSPEEAGFYHASNSDPTGGLMGIPGSNGGYSESPGGKGIGFSPTEGGDEIWCASDYYEEKWVGEDECIAFSVDENGEISAADREMVIEFDDKFAPKEPTASAGPVEIVPNPDPEPDSGSYAEDPYIGTGPPKLSGILDEAIYYAKNWGKGPTTAIGYDPGAGDSPYDTGFGVYNEALGGYLINNNKDVLPASGSGSSTGRDENEEWRPGDIIDNRPVYFGDTYTGWSDLPEYIQTHGIPTYDVM